MNNTKIGTYQKSCCENNVLILILMITIILLYGCIISQVFFSALLAALQLLMLLRRHQPRSRRPRLLLLMASTKFGVAFQTSSFLKGFLATSQCSLLDFGLVLYLGMYYTICSRPTQILTVVDIYQVNMKYSFVDCRHQRAKK